MDVRRDGRTDKAGKLTGEVKEENIGSQKTFEDLGYIKKKSKYGYQYEKKL